MPHKYFKKAVKITLENIESGGRPFGAVIVKDGEIIAEAVNTMLDDHDPTAHAEMTAIRKAGKALKSIDLTGCIVYATGEPCPMCQAAIYMSGIREVHYLFSNEDGAPYNLSTADIAKEMMKLPAERVGFIFKVAKPKVKAEFIDLYQFWHIENER